jgi:hypothetical protein
MLSKEKASFLNFFESVHSVSLFIYNEKLKEVDHQNKKKQNYFGGTLSTSI